MKGEHKRMKLTVFNGFVAEGTEAELAFYTLLLVESFRLKKEHDDKVEVDEWMKKYGDKTFEEIMKMEREDEE